MDFYAQQEAARKKSAWLTAVALLFAALVVAATGFVFTIAAWCVYLVLSDSHVPLEYWKFIERYPNVGPASYVVAFVVVLVSGLWSYARVASGEALMRLVGARKARRNSDQALLNVVEEMSIASGAEMPSVWVLDEDEGVNAFAAGRGEGDGAICVSSGALKFLVRDELQGVVAHEFGHVLNGDMRLNTHLAAMVEGLSGVAGLGRGMLWPIRKLIAKSFGQDDDSDGQLRWGGRRSGGGRSGGGGGVPGCGPVVLLILIYVVTGCALWLVGLAGIFFARLLQRAVSREREYLADAAAVQFTRNPEGLADALRFTRLLKGFRWSWRGPIAANVCHMFFVEESWVEGGTHPSVASRVARISRLPLAANDERFSARLSKLNEERRAKVAENFARYQRRQSVTRAFAPQTVIVPPALNARLRSAGEAGRILCALLRNEPIPEWKGAMSAAARRHVANRAIAAIQTWGSEAEAAAWSDKVDSLVREKGEVGSFELVVWCAARRRLRRQPPRPFRRAALLSMEAATVVATVASYGANPDAAYALARKRLVQLFKTFPKFARPCESARGFADALDRLRALLSPAKHELLAALRDVIAEDGVVTDDESNYLAAVADALGMPGGGFPSQAQATT